MAVNPNHPKVMSTSNNKQNDATLQEANVTSNIERTDSSDLIHHIALELCLNLVLHCMLDRISSIQ